MGGKRGTLEERFWPKVDMRGSDECWPWVATRHRGGNGGGEYGVIGAGPKGTGMKLAHRVAYELLVGPIPEGLVLDHLCENTLCVNPAHLEPVLNGVNVLRGKGPSATNARKTHCKYGHSLDDAYRTRTGARKCRSCRKERK